MHGEIIKEKTWIKRNPVWKLLIIDDDGVTFAFSDDYKNWNRFKEKCNEINKNNDLQILDEHFNVFLAKPVRKHNVSIPESLDTLMVALESKTDYRNVWISDLANAFIFALPELLQKRGKRYKSMNSQDLRDAAENAAVSFINNFINKKILP